MNGALLNRTEAGRRLAPLLREFADQNDAIVIALPRGGVPVGAEIAQRLRVPMDALVVRKLGVPGQEELAMGAIASNGVEFRDEVIIASLAVSAADVEAVVHREREELKRRERTYRDGRPPPPLNGKTVILVDDGIATGASMQVAVRAVKTQRPDAVIVAAPVASSEAADTLRKEATAIVTLLTTPLLFAIGQFYRDFAEVTDEDVQAALRQNAVGAAKPVRVESS